MCGFRYELKMKSLKVLSAFKITLCISAYLAIFVQSETSQPPIHLNNLETDFVSKNPISSDTKFAVKHLFISGRCVFDCDSFIEFKKDPNFLKQYLGRIHLRIVNGNILPPNAKIGQRNKKWKVKPLTIVDTTLKKLENDENVKRFLQDTQERMSGEKVITTYGGQRDVMTKDKYNMTHISFKPSEEGLDVWAEQIESRLTIGGDENRKINHLKPLKKLSEDERIRAEIKRVNQKQKLTTISKSELQQFAQNSEGIRGQFPALIAIENGGKIIVLSYSVVGSHLKLKFGVSKVSHETWKNGNKPMLSFKKDNTNSVHKRNRNSWNKPLIPISEESIHHSIDGAELVNEKLPPDMHLMSDKAGFYYEASVYEEKFFEENIPAPLNDIKIVAREESIALSIGLILILIGFIVAVVSVYIRCSVIKRSSDSDILQTYLTGTSTDENLSLA